MEFCLYEQNSIVYYSEMPEIAKKLQNIPPKKLIKEDQGV